MSEIMRKLDENYEILKRDKGVIDTRYYVGEIKDSKPEDFAREANVVLEEYIAGRVKRVELED